jgi:hypothetical protein
MTRAHCIGLAVAVALTIGSQPASAVTDPNVLCHKTVVKQLEKYKKTQLKLYRNCLDKQNKGDIASCLDAVSSAKLDGTAAKVAAAIAKKCTNATLAALGYRGDCQYGPATPGVGGTCAALAVTNPTEFTTCMECWKGAEFSRFVATLYASHASEVCGGALDETSAVCSDVGCTTPTPDQRDLGDNAENDCQRVLAKAGLNYLLKVEKALDRCMLTGASYAACQDDDKVELTIAKADTQLNTLVQNFCANYQPVASPQFCCRTGPAQACMVPVDREDCVMNLGGTVQEGKTCDMGSCANSPGPNKELTWWETCPIDASCPGSGLSDIHDVVECVTDVADGLVGNVLCLQFPNGAAFPTPVATPTPTVTPTP